MGSLYSALEFNNLKLLRSKLLSEHTQRALLNVSLHAVVALTCFGQFGLQLSRVLSQAFLIGLKLHSLLLKLLLDVHDLLLFARQLTADLHDFALELLFELNDPLLSSLQIGGFLADFALEGSHLLNRLVEELLSLSLTHLPVTSDFLDLLDLLLLQVRQKLGHFCPFPHL